ncbi:hypothetical protein LTS17_002182 [Exophiala oligosperma]
MGNKVHVTEHTGAYNAISHKSPHGLQCLKILFSEYDSSNPSRMALNDLLTVDFQDNTNGSDRNTGQNSGSSQTVFFEAVRFMVLDGDEDWTRIPLSGRIEVKVKENRFKLKDAVAQISSRRMTSDASQLVKRDLSRTATTTTLPMSPAHTSSVDLQPSTSQLVLANVPELPAANNTPSDTKSPPSYRKSQSSKDGPTRTPTVTSGSSVDAVEKPLSPS